MQDSIPLVFDFTFELDEEGLRIDSMLLKNGFCNLLHGPILTGMFLPLFIPSPNFIHLETNLPLRFEMDINNEYKWHH